MFDIWPALYIFLFAISQICTAVFSSAQLAWTCFQQRTSDSRCRFPDRIHCFIIIKQWPKDSLALFQPTGTQMQKVQVTDTLYVIPTSTWSLSATCSGIVGEVSAKFIISWAKCSQLNFVMSHFGRFMCDPHIFSASVWEMGWLRHSYALWFQFFSQPMSLSDRRAIYAGNGFIIKPNGVLLTQVLTQVPPIPDAYRPTEAAVCLTHRWQRMVERGGQQLSMSI